MGILRVSFLLRTPSVGHSYKTTNKRELAQDIAKGLKGTLTSLEPVRVSKGSVQHHFYVATQSDVQRSKAAAVEVLAKLIPDETMRKLVVVSVTEPDRDELENVRKSVDPKENQNFWEMVKALSPAKKEKKEKKIAADPLSRLAEKMVEGVSEPPLEPEQLQQEQKPLPLSDQTRKIQNLKEALLAKVRGQRHAVETVVNGIFESKMFSALDPNRKGPLATFLFTGPSGVGKTFLATLMKECLETEMLIVDMSEYTTSVSNGRFNGAFNQPAVVTGFARKHPNGIILFDEVEKAHINTIHQFLQILDGARMMDNQINQEVSFRNNIIIMTTNAGQSLYADPTVLDLSNVPTQVILDGLRNDINPMTREPFFPACITTRMASGKVILFNHLEPFALLQMVADELSVQAKIFEKTTGIKVNYDPKALAALVLYHGGGVADARSLRGLARSVMVRQLQEVVMQLMSQGAATLDSLKEITLNIDAQQSKEIGDLFVSRERMQAVVMTQVDTAGLSAMSADLQTDFAVITELGEGKRRIRGVTDFLLLDPLCGNEEKDQIPNDVEDLDSAGMRLFDYVREYMPEIPVYILDTTGKVRSFDTLLARGAKGVICMTGDDTTQLQQTIRELAFSALVNNATFSIGRSNKFLDFNSAQYVIDESCVVVSFEKLQLKSAPQGGDGAIIAQKGENNDLRFADVIGCRAAKEALQEFKEMLEDPRKTAMKGKKMPKGVLLYGPPGTGKTLLAKAMANECSATFIPTTATSFFAPYVGQTEQNIRELFAKARRYAPAIIFIDEVDAIGKRRTGNAGTHHNEDALTTFLSQMDGFVTDEKRPVFVLAATNYAVEGEGGQVLDGAFVRRFDRKILVPLPNTDDRYELLKKSLERHGIHFGENHEQILRNMAKRTSGMNNADLEMVNANYARILGEGEPDGAAYMDSLDSYRFGEVNKLDPKELRQTACHEAGHALVCRLGGVTPSFLTVVSRGHFGGYMESAGEKEHGTYTYEELMGRVCRCLAGRAAEIEVYGETAGNNTGASSDIRQARYFMKSSLNDYAMGEKLYAEWTQEEIEVQMRKQYQRTCEMIRTNRAVLDALTDRLVQQKSMDQGQLEEFFTSMGV